MLPAPAHQTQQRQEQIDEIKIKDQRAGDRFLAVLVRPLVAEHVERENLLRYSLKLRESNQTTVVDVTHQVELRRQRAWELHPGVGLMTEARLSNALQRRINEAIENFLARVKEKLEAGSAAAVSPDVR